MTDKWTLLQDAKPGFVKTRSGRFLLKTGVVPDYGSDAVITADTDEIEMWSGSGPDRHPAREREMVRDVTVEVVMSAFLEYVQTPAGMNAFTKMVIDELEKL
jgi:hypothetical protein